MIHSNFKISKDELKPYEWVCGINIPAWYVAYANDCAVSTFSPATSVNDLYVHAIFETQTWQGFDVFTGATFTWTTGWVLATDTASVQIAVDAAMISQWFSAWDAIYGYNSTTNEVIIFFSPAADPVVTWRTLELRAGWDANPSTYSNKCKFWTLTTTEAEWEKYIKVKTVCWDTSSTSDWLPVCFDGTQYYVRDVENNWVYTTEYKKWHDGTIFTGLPTGSIVTEWYCNLLIQRIHENFVVTGTTPLIIPAGAISISVTKTNNTGVVNISGDNATAFPLTFNRENFTDGVNEEVSTLSEYTITGTLAGTTYKVHIIR